MVNKTLVAVLILTLIMVVIGGCVQEPVGIYGTVQWANNSTAVSGASVTLSVWNATRNAYDVKATGVTDTSGEYSLAGTFPAGVYQLKATLGTNMEFFNLTYNPGVDPSPHYSPLLLESHSTLSTATPSKKPCYQGLYRGTYYLNYCNNEPPITHSCVIVGPQETQRGTISWIVNDTAPSVVQSSTPSMKMIQCASVVR